MSAKAATEYDDILFGGDPVNDAPFSSSEYDTVCAENTKLYRALRTAKQECEDTTERLHATEAELARERTSLASWATERERKDAMLAEFRDTLTDVLRQVHTFEDKEHAWQTRLAEQTEEAWQLKARLASAEAEVARARDEARRGDGRRATEVDGLREEVGRVTGLLRDAEAAAGQFQEGVRQRDDALARMQAALMAAEAKADRQGDQLEAARGELADVKALAMDTARQLHIKEVELAEARAAEEGRAAEWAAREERLREEVQDANRRHEAMLARRIDKSPPPPPQQAREPSPIYIPPVFGSTRASSGSGRGAAGTMGDISRPASSQSVADSLVSLGPPDATYGLDVTRSECGSRWAEVDALLDRLG